METTEISFDSNQSTHDDLERRRELADFLRTRRERILPSLDHQPRLRRRTPGLRREEVAEMAGVSASWYTWLEQARDIKPSSDLLMRIGNALQLNSSEMKHLFLLSGRTPPEMSQSARGDAPEALTRLVQEALHVPAFVIGERFDILVWNSKFTEYFFDPGLLPIEKRNWLEIIFTLPHPTKYTIDWDEIAKRTVAEFRSAIGEQIGSPLMKDFITRLRNESPHFDELWRRHDVLERRNLIFHITHQQHGKMTFERSTYIPIEAQNMILIMLVPIQNSMTN